MVPLNVTPIEQTAPAWGTNKVLFTDGAGTLPAYSLAFIFDDTAYTDANAFKTAVSGMHMVYKRATTTTETADSYNTPQVCDNWGTEEFVDTRTVPMPVGNISRYGETYPISSVSHVHTYSTPNLCDPDELLNGYAYRQGDGTLMESSTKVAVPKLRLYGKDKIAISFDKTVQNTRVNWIVFNENGEKLYWDSQNTADSSWRISDDRVGKVLSFNYNVYPTAYAVGFYFDAAGVTVVDTLSDIMITFTNTVVDYVSYGYDYNTDLNEDVYGGYADILESDGGKSLYGDVDLGSLTWTLDYNTGAPRVYGATLSAMEEATNAGMTVQGLYCDGYLQSTTSPWSGLQYMENNSVARVNDKVYVRDDGFSDADTFTQAVTGLTLVYKLKSPTTLNYTKKSISMKNTVNYIWCDEGPITVEYGTDPDMIVNPTLFGCSPLIETEGYGTLGFNGYSISLANATMGDVILGENANDVKFNPAIANSGDTITVQARFDGSATPKYISMHDLDALAVSQTPSKGTAAVSPLFTGSMDVECAINGVVDTFTVGTSATKTYTAKFYGEYVKSGLEKDFTLTMTASLVYDATKNQIKATLNLTSNNTDYVPHTGEHIILSAVVASSVSILGTPTYIDCDLGEVYKVEDGSVISLDRYVDLGADLPELASGTNVFTHDNTFTKIDVQPRWWTV